MSTAAAAANALADTNERDYTLFTQNTTFLRRMSDEEYDIEKVITKFVSTPPEAQTKITQYAAKFALIATKQKCKAQINPLFLRGYQISIETEITIAHNRTQSKLTIKKIEP